MNREELLKKIRAKARVDAKNRRDHRFLETMGFLVAKGFLKTNLDIPLLPNKRVPIAHAIWAGVHVEPRILEVLPAAVLRLKKHFDFDPVRHVELAKTVEHLQRREEKGADFYGMPYDKVKLWMDFPLRDKRMKPLTDRKQMKAFRLNPKALERLKVLARERKCSETEILESLLLSA